MMDAATVADQFPEPVLAIDDGGAVAYANDQFLDTTALDRDAVTGSSYTDLDRVFAEGFSRLRDAVSVVASLETDERHVQATVAPADGASAERVGARVTRLGDDRDASVLVVLRAAADQSGEPFDESLHHEMVSLSSDVLTIVDEDGTITYVSSSVRRVLGYDPEDLVGESGFDYQHPADRRKVADALTEATSNPGEPVSVEVRFRHADGSWTWIESTIRDPRENDAIDGLLVSSRDVTGRRGRQRDQERAETLFENTQDALFVVDVGGGADEFRLTRVNGAYERLTGLSNEQLTGRTVEEAFGPDDGGDIAARYRECVTRREPIEYVEELSVPEPGSHWDTRIAPVVVDDEVVQLVGATRDVTTVREREQALERSERLLETLPVGVYQHASDTDDGFRLVNEKMVDILDAESKADLRARPVASFFADPSACRAFVERLTERGVVRDEHLRLETLSGDTIWGSVTAIAHEVDGETVYDGAIQDVTERERYEQRLESQRDDLEVLNQVVRHDIRNNLQLVTAYADMAADHVDDAGRAHVGKIQEGASQAVELTETARELAGVMMTEETTTHAVGLASVLEREVAELRDAYADADVTVAGELPARTVLANELLDSVFRNLLKNAVQHNDTDAPAVTVSAEPRDESVVVRVADNGPGVPDSRKEDVFGKGEKGLNSAGTGVGLYLVRSLVETYGGRVWVEDNDPRGAVFAVELPTVEV
ncbi:PAS domain S-box protein [Halobacterium litoreum]|uniref:histidine kinase n=1 Tax=Halobacterium litoreum TaxID=2039234 RepID=A0ABD5NFP9_9EURY|nr:PAS domain S-box protein [Halobacterium litoreum]UHH13231.1 PAS domain S-box protein [Halobacterium litoreum]